MNSKRRPLPPLLGRKTTMGLLLLLAIVFLVIWAITKHREWGVAAAVCAVIYVVFRLILFTG